MEIKNQLGLDPQASFEEFYYDKAEDIDHKIRIQKIPIWFTLPIILISLSIVLFSFFALETSIQMFLGIFSGVGMIFFMLLFQFVLQNLFITYKISQVKQKLFSPEQFEHVFKEAIEEVTKPKRGALEWFKQVWSTEKKVDKVVIIIDNIDRCHKQLALQLLLSIKNFLGLKKCIFIIPIDDEAIKNHLDFNHSEGEEFLRKFFSTTIRIKKYSSQDLYEFTCSLMNKYQLQFSRTVANIISQEFSKNPRRIIQFLNNLSAEFNVAEYQEASGVISKSSITDNTDFLAKVLLIREEWPVLYERINSSPYLLYQINNYIRNGEFKRDKDKEPHLYFSDGINIQLTQDQYRFLFRTQSIKTTNIDPFLRLQDLDKDVPDELFNHINNGDWPSIKNFIGETGTNIDKLWDILKKQLDEGVTRRGLVETEGMALLSLLFEIIADKEYEDYFEDIYQEFGPFTNDARLKLIIPNFNPQNLLNYSKKLSEEGENYLRDNIAASLNELGGKISEYRDIVKEYIKSYITNSTAIIKIKAAFSQLINTDILTLDDEEFKTLLRKNNAAKHLIKKQFINVTIDEIQNDYQNNDVIRRVKIIQFLNDVHVVTPKLKSKYLQKIHPFANNNEWPITLFWLQSMVGFIKEAESLSETKLQTTLENRHNFFFQQFYDAGQRGKIQIQCVITLMSLLKEYYFGSEAVYAPSVQHLIKYFNRNESKEVYFHGNKLLKDIIDHYQVYNWPFTDHVINRFESIPETEGKNAIADTLLLMLKKTECIEGNWKSLQPNQIKLVIKKFFSELFSNDQEKSQKAANWIYEVGSIVLIKPFIKEEVNSISDPLKLKGVLPLVSTILGRSVNSAISDAIIRSDTSYKKLSENVETVVKIKYGRVYARTSLLKLLDETKLQKIDPYKSVLQVCIDQQQIFKVTHIEKMIDDKFVPILGHEFPHAIFACEQLIRVKRIPESKHSLLRTLVGRIRIPTDDSDRDIHKQILSKLKKRLKK